MSTDKKNTTFFFSSHFCSFFLYLSWCRFKHFELCFCFSMPFRTFWLILRKKKDTILEISCFFEKPCLFFRFQYPYFPMLHFWRVRNSSVFNLESKIEVCFKGLKLFLTQKTFGGPEIGKCPFFFKQKPMCSCARNFRCLHFSNLFFTLSHVASRKLMPNLKSNRANWHNVWDSRKKKIPFGNKTEKRIFVCFCFFEHNYLFDKRALIFFFSKITLLLELY